MLNLRHLLITAMVLAVCVVPALAQAPLCTESPTTNSYCTYLPLLDQPFDAILPTLTPTTAPTSVPTPPPTPLPPSFSNCQDDPNASKAPNYPVRIVSIDKEAETVTLQNIGPLTIGLADWKMCSTTGNQRHPLSGSIAPGQTRTFPGPAAAIWNNTSRDDGALYDASGSLASYYVDK